MEYQISTQETNGMGLKSVIFMQQTILGQKLSVYVNVNSNRKEKFGFNHMCGKVSTIKILELLTPCSVNRT